MPLLRIVCPPARTDSAVRVLAAEGRATEISVLAGATSEPADHDLILAQVPRARVDDLVARMAALPSGVRVAAERSVPLLPHAEASGDDEAVVWAQVVRDIHAAGRLSWVNVLLTVAAAAIAAIGIIEDQLLLIVGAMALSPDYFPIADTCLALSRRAWRAARRAAATLLVSFGAAAAGAWVLSETLAALGLASVGEQRLPALTLFISHPDALSVVVALIAGAAGALAITLPDARGLVGVFVSVTTIPAAADIGVAVVARDPGELAGAAVQLAANVAGLVVAGTVTLVLRHRGRAHGVPRHPTR